MQRLAHILFSSLLSGSIFLSGAAFTQVSTKDVYVTQDEQYALWTSFVDLVKAKIQLPLLVDEYTILDDLYADKNIIYYNYRITLNRKDVDLAQLEAQVNAHFDDRICYAGNTSLPMLQEIDAKLIFIYNFADGVEEQLTYSVNRCKPS